MGSEFESRAVTRVDAAGHEEEGAHLAVRRAAQRVLQRGLLRHQSFDGKGVDERTVVSVVDKAKQAMLTLLQEGEISGARELYAEHPEEQTLWYDAIRAHLGDAPAMAGFSRDDAPGKSLSQVIRQANAAASAPSARASAASLRARSALAAAASASARAAAAFSSAVASRERNCNTSASDASSAARTRSTLLGPCTVQRPRSGPECWYPNRALTARCQ